MHLLDANVFIEASQSYYAFDLVPGLGDPTRVDDVASVAAVRDELVVGTGDLVMWAKARPSSFWLAETAESIAAMTQLATWAAAPERSYWQAAIDEFFDSADLRLIAVAMSINATVVTRERPAPDSKKSIKIPDVCSAFGVACTDPFTAYRVLGLALSG